AHHDHYDTGHFSIQAHGGLLAPQTGLYGQRAGGYFGRHRLGYALQTVSANSLLVLAPGETSAYLADKRRNGKCDWDSLSGGQRVMRPTGFHCVSMEHYRRQMNGGPHLERATVTQFQSAPGDFDYVAADITAAYNSTRWSEPGRKPKVEAVTRQFLYLREPRAFVIHDRVEKTRADHRARFLLHHLARPRGGEESVLAGTANDGILTIGSRVVTSEHGGGRLIHAAVLPAGGTTLLIGGPTYRCYVEGDGDGDFSKGFSGEKLDPGPGAAKYRHTHAGLWRTEVCDGGKSRSTRFLNLLFPRKAGEDLPKGLYSEVRTKPELVAVRVADTVCVFASRARPLESFELSLPEAGLRVLLLDAAPGRTYSAGGRKAAASAEGVLVLEKLPAGRIEIR
ncbi:MAG: hypothetical protein ACYTGB_14435, partial [Planctomycetota bacterium]